MPPKLKQFLEGCSNTETGKVLKVLEELTDRTGFVSTLSTVNQALFFMAHPMRTTLRTSTGVFSLMYRNFRQCRLVRKYRMSVRWKPTWLLTTPSWRRGVLQMLEAEIISCCKRLKLSRNLAEMAQTTEGWITSGILVQATVSRTEKPWTVTDKLDWLILA